MTNMTDISREYPLTPLMGVGAIITDGNRAVLVKRGSPPSANEWSIPGGLVKVGETLHEAVIREVREECGLHVEPVRLVELLERIFRDDRGRVQYHYVLADYLCTVAHGVLAAGSDAAEVRWANREELTHLNVAPITMKVIFKGMAQAKEQHPSD